MYPAGLTFALPPPTSQSVLQGLPPCKPFWPDCMNLPSACADSVLGCCLCRPSLACNKHAAFPKETSCRREHNLALPTRQLCHCAGQGQLLITGHAQVCLVIELDNLMLLVHHLQQTCSLFCGLCVCIGMLPLQIPAGRGTELVAQTWQPIKPAVICLLCSPDRENCCLLDPQADGHELVINSSLVQRCS